MKIFVYEYLSGSPSACAAAASLRVEGRAMLTAVLGDLQLCPGLETVTLLNAPDNLPGATVVVSTAKEEEAVYRALVAAADYTLVIAPETELVLWQRCRWVEEQGGRLLGPNPTAVRLCGDKLALAAHLAEAALPGPATRLLEGALPCPFPFPVVLKPRDGAGSVATSLVDSERCWRSHIAADATEAAPGERIVQPYLPGKAASVAVIASRNPPVALLPAAQHLSSDGCFHYLGGRAPLPPGESKRASYLAEAAVASVPGLQGFVGVDLVLDMAGNPGRDGIIEINPRLTTSYVGLRVLAKFNIAAAVVAAVTGDELPPIEWNTGCVTWRPDGTVTRIGD